MNETTQQPVPFWHSTLLPMAMAALVGALCVLLFASEKSSGSLALLLAAVALGLIATQVALSWESVRISLFHRSTALSLNAGVQVVLVFAILAMVDHLAWRYSERVPWMPKWDVTEQSMHTLAKQTLDVLARIEKRKSPVTVKAFFLDPRGISRQEQSMAAQREQVKALLERYGRITDKLKFELVNPEAKPLEAKQYQITVNGTVVFEADGRKLEVTASDLFSGGGPAHMGGAPKFKGEQVFTSKLLDILEGKKRKLYFLVGHREADIEKDEPAGFSALRELLTAESYDVEKLNLLTLADVPEDCTVLVIAGPKLELAPVELEAIGRYLAAKKPLLCMLDSQPLNRGLAALLAGFGVKLRPNLLIEPDPDNHYPGRPVMPIPQLNGHAITNPLMEDQSPVILNEVLGLENVPGHAGHDVRTLMQASAEAWGETNLTAETRAVDKDPDDLQPPVAAAFAVSSKQGSNDGLEQRPTDELRMVVIGDSDFVGNGLVSLAPGNSNFFLNCLAWLTKDTDRITIRPKEFVEKRAVLPEGVGNRIVVGLVLALPLIVVLVGFSVWWQRRAT